MLRNETIQKLKSLRLSGFAEALQEQYESEQYDMLSFDERLGLLIDRECARRESNRLKRLISNAHFKNSQASIENLYYEPLRKLDRSLVMELASCNYIYHGKNVNILGATGVGKSYLAQALGVAACRAGLGVLYTQLPELLDELKIAEIRGQDKYLALQKKISKIPLLIIDEWLLFSIEEKDAERLLRIIDRRSNSKSTIVVSQFRPDEWINQIPVQVAAEAITDRLTAKAYTIVLESKTSLRTI